MCRAASTAATALAVLILAHPLSAAPTDVSADAIGGKTTEVTITATADGTVPLAFQWEKAPLDAPASFAVVKGATAAVLKLTDISAASAGVYRVQISNAAGSIVSPTATVRIVYAPTLQAFTVTVVQAPQ